jgi:hypothetical protein
MLILLAIWMLSVPILELVVLVVWLKRLRSELPFWRSTLGLASVFAVLVNWVWFLLLSYSGQIGGFGTHQLTSRSVDRYLWVVLAAIPASLALKQKSRILAAFAAFLMFALWGGSEMVA